MCWLKKMSNGYKEIIIYHRNATLKGFATTRRETVTRTM